jgi:hypothetical protein
MKLHTLLRELTEHANAGRHNHQIVVVDDQGRTHYLLGSGESVEWSDDEKIVYVMLDAQ